MGDFKNIKMAEITELKPWSPTQHVGTSWVAAAEDHDVKVVFWLVVVQLVFAGLTVINWVCRARQYQEVPQEEEEEQDLKSKLKKVERQQVHWTSILSVVMPILGMCAIKLDSQEILKSFCITMLVTLVMIALGLVLSFAVIMIAGSCVGGLGGGIAATCIVILTLVGAGIGCSLQIVCLVFSWKYAYP